MVCLVLHIINTTQSFLCRIRLQWRHNERDGVSNNRGQDCLLNLCSGTDQRIDQSSALLAFVRGIHRWPVNSPHKGPVSGRYSIWWRHHDDTCEPGPDVLSPPQYTSSPAGIYADGCRGRHTPEIYTRPGIQTWKWLKHMDYVISLPTELLHKDLFY